MLLSKDIWALLEQERSAFRTIQLINCTVVVNAFDFLHTVIRASELDSSYGGEYRLMEQKFEENLKTLLRCNIKPLFVFGGANPCTVSVKVSIKCHIKSIKLDAGKCSAQLQKISYFAYLYFAE